MKKKLISDSELFRIGTNVVSWLHNPQHQGNKIQNLGFHGFQARLYNLAKNKTNKQKKTCKYCAKSLGAFYRLGNMRMKAEKKTLKGNNGSREVITSQD